jgi:WD40 repeat protein
VLDQLEEYFLYHEGDSGAGTLLEELPEVLRRRGLRANLLLGIREDSLARLDAFKGRIPNLFANTLRLERLDRQAAEAAIVGPVREYNRLRPSEDHVEIEPELVDAILDQVAAGRVDLGRAGRGGLEEESHEARVEAPYLQLVLERLWEVERVSGSRRLHLETLRELGGAAQVVRDHLERAMAELSPNEKDAAAAMYNHLVTPSGTKIAHRARDLAGYAAVNEAEAVRVLGRLVEERIVRAGEDGAAGPRYEIFHDVLADAVLAWRARHEADRRLEAERAAAEQRHRRTRIFALAAAVAVAVLAGISVYALIQRSNARTETRHAHARELAALSSSELAADPERSLRLALQANAVERSPQTEEVLRTALRLLRVLAVLPGGGPLAGAEFGPDGKLVVTAGGGGEARLFRSDTGELVRSLRHGAPLAAASFSPDGSLVVTAGRDGVARTWNARTGDGLVKLRHAGAVTSATFSPDGTLLATTSADRTARLWDVASGRLLRRLQHPHAVKSASFSADGTLLVTVVADVARDRVARVFDVRSGRLVQRLVQPEHERVTSARFAPKGDRVVTGSGHDAARIWNARTGRLLLKLEGHKAAVLDTAFSPTGDRVVTASADQGGRLWNAQTGELLAVLANHTNQVVRARFSPDGKFVVTASADRKSSVFDAFDGGLQATLIGHGDSVVDAVFSPDGAMVATASLDGTVRLWDPLRQPLLATLGAHRGAVNVVAFSPDGRLVASAGEDGAVRIWRFRGGLVETLATGAPVSRAAFSPDGTLVFAVSADATVRVWRISDWSRAATFRHRFRVTAADVSPDARFVATADADGVLRLWEVANGRQRWLLPRGRKIAVVAFSPDSGMLATGGSDKVVRLRRIGDGRLVHGLAGHHGSIVAASFSPDGSRLVSSSSDKTARIWNTGTGALEAALRGHRAPLTSASFSPDGRLVVTTSVDHDSRVWFAATGRQRWSPLRQAAVVGGAAFSADGRWMATASQSAGVWDMSNGRYLFLLRPQDRLVTAVAFSPSGWRIVAGGLDGTVGKYECRLCAGADELIALAQARLAHLRPSVRGR